MDKDFDSASLFRTPVPYVRRKPRKLNVFTIETDGIDSIRKLVSVEDEIKKNIAIDFEHQKVSTLVENGVQLHAIDIQDSNSLGIDSEINAIADYCESNLDKFVKTNE